MKCNLQGRMTEIKKKIKILCDNRDFIWMEDNELSCPGIETLANILNEKMLVFS